MGFTNGQAAAFYFARKHHRDKHARMFVVLSPREATIVHQTVAADTQVSQVSSVLLVRPKPGITTYSLTGPNAASFVLSGRSVRVKAGTVLVAGVPITCNVVATNTIKGAASAKLILQVT